PLAAPLLHYSVLCPPLTYALSLHDALPISEQRFISRWENSDGAPDRLRQARAGRPVGADARSRGGGAEDRAGLPAVRRSLQPRLDPGAGPWDPRGRDTGDGGRGSDGLRLPGRAVGVHDGHGTPGLGRVAPCRDLSAPRRAPGRLSRRVPRDD